MADTPRLIWAPRAWLNNPGPRGGAWYANVLLEIDTYGHWADVRANVAEPPPDATVISGALLPGLVNAHSHAFQRAFAGLTERRETAGDDFWSWRERMYRVALRITPVQMSAIAAQLYSELLAGGYTQVCEFHYLHHQQDGAAYDDPLEMSWALADAASDAGMGVTLLPVLYERAGFAQPELRADQRRFRSDAAWVWSASQRIASEGRPGVRAGLALHSLRAASPESMAALRQLSSDWQGPIHIHVSEQMAEVNDCLQHTGARPMAWLAGEGYMDARWHLVHATHSTPPEIEAVARSGASVVICPSTEANLGDGLADLPGWLRADVPISVGSDSHASRDWCEELRWLEYGQRLALRQRNVAAAPERGEASTAARLFDGALRAGAAAAGYESWGLCKGARADALVLPGDSPALLGIPQGQWLDAQVFSSPGPRWADVMVRGQWVIQSGTHRQAERIATRFAAAMQELWAGE